MKVTTEHQGRKRRKHRKKASGNKQDRKRRFVSYLEVDAPVPEERFVEGREIRRRLMCWKIQ